MELRGHSPAPSPPSHPPLHPPTHTHHLAARPPPLAACPQTLDHGTTADPHAPPPPAAIFQPPSGVSNPTVRLAQNLQRHGWRYVLYCFVRGGDQLVYRTTCPSCNNKRGMEAVRCVCFRELGICKVQLPTSVQHGHCGSLHQQHHRRHAHTHMHTRFHDFTTGCAPRTHLDVSAPGRSLPCLHFFLARMVGMQCGMHACMRQASKSRLRCPLVTM